MGIYIFWSILQLQLVDITPFISSILQLQVIIILKVNIILRICYRSKVIWQELCLYPPLNFPIWSKIPIIVRWTQNLAGHCDIQSTWNQCVSHCFDFEASVLTTVTHSLAYKRQSKRILWVDINLSQLRCLDDDNRHSSYIILTYLL